MSSSTDSGEEIPQLSSWEYISLHSCEFGISVCTKHPSVSAKMFFEILGVLGCDMKERTLPNVWNEVGGCGVC